jgi:hypothetical protein
MLAFAALLAVALGAWALHTLASAPGDWRQPLRIGPWQREVSVSVLLRLATHPMMRPLIDGRRLHLASGEWQLRSRADGEIDASCAPCRWSLPALGPWPLTLPHAQLQLRRVDLERYAGSLRLGDPLHPVELTWRAHFGVGGPRFALTLPETPAAHVAALFAADIAELAHARIDGTLALRVRVDGPAARMRIEPRLEGFAVYGLGTEALLDATPPTVCRGSARAGPVAAGWLPRAVIAAEDQRFHEHPGYDLSQTIAAWQRNQSRGAVPHGASTLSQQLAKLLYAGDERSAARKLRELLYAVEMERTLGKARILQLYLAVVPWGSGVCGAEDAARSYLGKSASQLGVTEAAWLASLLTNPGGEWRRAVARGAIDRERVERVIADMRPMNAERRLQALERLDTWSPPSLNIDATRAAASGALNGGP